MAHARRSFVDRALGAVGLRRVSAPARRPALRAAYGAGQENRLVASMQASILSANQEVAAAIRLGRARARALVQNNGYAAGFVAEVVNNVVGPDGIQLRAQNRTLTGQLATATNDEIERAWTAWDVPEVASMDGHDGWTEIQQLAVETMVVDGEAFVREVKGADNPFGYALELIDADLLDETFNRQAGDGRNEIRMGVELTTRGRPVAYHFWTRHPSEVGARARVAIPAEEVRHLFVRRRPGQVRGMTWFAPVLLPFYMLGEYEVAEITAARWAAMKLGIWEPGPDADADESEPEEVQLEAQPGELLKGPQGYTLKQFDPQHPNAAASTFLSVILRGIGRGLGASYLTLTGDLTAANYSSMRAGLLPERDHWRRLQRWLSRTLHRRVYASWLEMALLAGALRVDSRLASQYADVTWRPRGWQWVDPLKDVQAIERKIKLGLDTRTAAAADEGRDYEEIVDELHDEQEYADQEGVDVDGVDPRASVASDPAETTAPQNSTDAPAATTRLRAVR